jgi:quinol monooxygenase YgiN
MIEGASKEEGALAYEWFLSADHHRCRLLETYADANATQAHLDSSVVKQLVPKLLQLAKLDRFEVYGSPDARAAEALRAVGATIYPHWKGLPRTTSVRRTI